jgi:hypothetical protein
VRKKQINKDPLAEFERDWKRGLGDGLDTRSIFPDVLHMRYYVLFQGKSTIELNKRKVDAKPARTRTRTVNAQERIWSPSSARGKM